MGEVAVKFQKVCWEEDSLSPVLTSAEGFRTTLKKGAGTIATSFSGMAKFMIFYCKVICQEMENVSVVQSRLVHSKILPNFFRY